MFYLFYFYFVNQVEILGRQISALLTQVDAKKRDFFEFVAKELQELQDCGKIKEVRVFFFCLCLIFKRLDFFVKFFLIFL